MAYDGQLVFDTAVDTDGLQKGTNKITSLVKGLGAFELIKKGMAMVASSIDDAVSRVDTLKRFPRIMEQMGFGADTAQVSISKLSSGIEGLPTTLDQIVAGTQRMALVTGDLDLATDSALALNNALYASGATTELASSATEQYTQALSKGKPDMIEWRSMLAAMPYAMEKVAESFGYTGTGGVNNFGEALRGGEITMAEFNQRLIELNGGVGGFAELAQTSAGGIATSWKNVQTAVVKGVANVIQAIDEGLESFGGISGVMDSVKGAVNGAFTVIATGAKLLIQNFVPLTAGVVAFSVAIKGVQLLSLIGQLGSVTAALKTMLPGIVAVTAAKVKDTAATIYLHALYAKDAILKGLSTAADLANAAARKVVTAATNGSIVATIAYNAATAAATAAQWLWNAALAANPIGLVIAGVAALVVGIIALVSWLGNSNAAYKEQKAAVEELTEAQEALADATSESESTYKSTASEIAATAKVSEGYIGTLRDVQNGTASTEDKHRQMADTVAQLNSAVDGLNIAYDEETGSIRNVNTGQEISIDQLEELVAAKNELAQANAWQQRANELVQEQVRIQEELAVIEAKKNEIMADTNLTTSQQNKLIAELDETAEGHATTMADVETRLEIVNENLSTSNTTMAESVVSDYERMEQAVTESGESIDQVATQWGVSVDEILAAMERENISLDEWVTKQEDAWADYEAAVKDKTKGVINSFKEIPGEYDMSAQEMLEVLQSNKERYAAWEKNMEEITKQLGPTAAAEFAALGPEANSAMEEILASTDLLDEYREVFGVKIDEATGLAVEDWTDPAFIGAPSDAIDTSAQMVAENTALGTAVTGQVDEAHAAMVAAVDAVDFTSIGQGIADDIISGVKGADFSAMMTAVSSSIRSGTGGVTSAVTAMSTSVQTVVRNMSTQVQTATNTMMTSINTAVVSRTATIRSSFTSMGNGITTVMNSIKTQATSIMQNTMTAINTAIVSRTATIESSVTTMGNGVVTAMTDMKTKATAQAEQMMTAINTAIVSRTGTLKSSATAAANGVGDSWEPMVTGATNAANRMMDGIMVAMNNKAGSLYAKAREIADNIAKTMAAALDVHSPSRVMIGIFENVMLGVYEGMAGMEGSIYNKAEEISDGISERLTISPDVSDGFASRLRSMVESNPFRTPGLIPATAGAGAGGSTGSTNVFNTYITTPKPVTAAEATRELQDMIKRTQNQLP